MEMKSSVFIMIPEEELTYLKTTQQQILRFLEEHQTKKESLISVRHVTAIEFMAAVRICRSKFDKLVQGNKIKTIKKKRKIYVPTSEIERYFIDPSIQ